MQTFERDIRLCYEELNKLNCESDILNRKMSQAKFNLMNRETDITVKIAKGDIKAKNADERKALIASETKKESAEIVQIKTDLDTVKNKASNILNDIDMNKLLLKKYIAEQETKAAEIVNQAQQIKAQMLSVIIK